MSTNLAVKYRARIIFCLVICAIVFLSGCQPDESEEGFQGSPYTPHGISDSRLGITWISTYWGTDIPYNRGPKNEYLQRARDAGATWDRWDFRFEDGQYAFEKQNVSYSTAVDGDNAVGLNILAVINGGV